MSSSSSPLPVRWVTLPTLGACGRIPQHGLAWELKMQQAGWMLLPLGTLTASGLFLNKSPNPCHQGVAQAGDKAPVNLGTIKMQNTPSTPPFASFPLPSPPPTCVRRGLQEELSFCKENQS